MYMIRYVNKLLLLLLRFKDHFPHAYFMVTSIINIIF